MSGDATLIPFDWSYPLAFCWGLLVLGSLAGWGQMLMIGLLPRDQHEEVRWGLKAAWGMAFFLVLSGPLIALSLFNRAFVAGFVLTGVVFAAGNLRELRKEVFPAWPRNGGLRIFWIGLLLLIALNYTGAVAIHWYNSADDFGAYFAQAKMLLDTGTYFDPFDFRLMVSLEGQQTLSTLIVGFLPWKYAQMLDSGVAWLVMLGMVWGMVRGSKDTAWVARLLLLALAVMTEIPRINSTSAFTGAALFLAIFLTFDLMARRRLLDLRSIMLLAGVVTAAATLRSHYFFLAVLLSLGFVFIRGLEKKQQGSLLRETLVFVAVLVAFLAPWCLSAYRSNGTFLYPVFKGDQPAYFNMYKDTLSPAGTALWIAGFYGETGYFLIFVPILFCAADRQRHALLVYGAAVFVITCALVAHVTEYAYTTFTRYLIPIGAPFGLFSSGVVAVQIVAGFETGCAPIITRGKIAAIVTMAVIFLQGGSFLGGMPSKIRLIGVALDARNDLATFPFDPVPFHKDVLRDYPRAFAQIPPGKRVLIALDYPFLLDYRAHEIFSIDMAGGSSLPPGLPYFQGAEAVKNYLLAHGIRYIAHVPFDRSTYLHCRQQQAKNLVGRIAEFRYTAKFELDWMSNVDELARSSQILYLSPYTRVIDLGVPVALSRSF